jgi:hypothetical protein
VLGALCAGGDHEEGASGGSGAGGSGRWQLNLGYRWQDSNRHFVGDVEQPQRIAQNTQQENQIHLFDVGLSYRLNRRWTLSFSAPIMDADRLNHRTGGLTETTGLGDISVGARFWVFRPPTETRQNIQVGFSLKLPTGRPDATSRITGVPNPSTAVTTVDQSIQLGDSGTGVAIDFLAYKSLPARLTLFSTGVYLFNPKNTYTATTPGARELSVPDQYLLRGGLGYAVPKLRGIALSVAGRVEGVPARDIIGREDGFRRPGYAVSVEPGVQYAHRTGLWSVSYAIAVHRDRTRSVPDIRAGTHGDAAFADGVLMVGYSRSF